jgi:hypothetical protein
MLLFTWPGDFDKKPWKLLACLWQILTRGSIESIVVSASLARIQAQQGLPPPRTMNNGIETNDGGLLARYSALPPGSGSLRYPCVPGYIYRPLGPLHPDDDIDMLLAELFQGPTGTSSKSRLRSDLEEIVVSDQWTSICPFRVGYHGNDQHKDTDNELTLLFTVRFESMTSERAAAVVSEAREVLAR